MSLLKTLKLTTATPAPMAPPKERLRSKLIGLLEEQKALALAQIEGRAFQATKMVTRRSETGERLRVQAPRHIRRGWFQDVNGTVFFQVRYGPKPMELAKGVNAIEAGKLDALPGVIDTLIEAVKGGELDQQLTAAAAERKKNFRKGTDAA